MASRNAVLVAKDVTKSYGDHTIVNSFSLTVRPGQAVALTGR
ncbi:MAG: ABC transporter ATP-binding protein, partial [Propionibacterium sp.]|nr:ABC transporter ATP-binding protein [Propionibacterium sp.]